jgi:hypothetical protein
MNKKLIAVCVLFAVVIAGLTVALISNINTTNNQNNTLNALKIDDFITQLQQNSNPNIFELPVTVDNFTSAILYWESVDDYDINLVNVSMPILHVSTAQFIRAYATENILNPILRYGNNFCGLTFNGANQATVYICNPTQPQPTQEQTAQPTIPSAQPTNLP